MVGGGPRLSTLISRPSSDSSDVTKRNNWKHKGVIISESLSLNRRKDLFSLFRRKAAESERSYLCPHFT